MSYGGRGYVVYGKWSNIDPDILEDISDAVTLSNETMTEFHGYIREFPPYGIEAPCFGQYAVDDGNGNATMGYYRWAFDGEAFKEREVLSDGELCVPIANDRHGVEFCKDDLQQIKGFMEFEARVEKIVGVERPKWEG